MPKNLSNTLSFKSGVVKTGASELEMELLGEKAYSLGQAAQLVEKSLNALDAFIGTEVGRDKLIQLSADAVHAFFVQRELMGFSDHHHPIDHYKIPKHVLNKVGAKCK